MKLVYCPRCGDVFNLKTTVWRACTCGLSGGQYATNSAINQDPKATIGGSARVFGIPNDFFESQWLKSTEEEKQQTAKRHGYRELCWWGGQEGDHQISHIEEGKGPSPYEGKTIGYPYEQVRRLRDSQEIYLPYDIENGG